MIGITACGVYIPRYRLKRDTISSAMGWLNRLYVSGEKAVANYDEDSVTMAVAVGTECLREIKREEIDGVFFATTTAPYLERESATIVGSALDLRPDIRTADFAHSIKSGTSALLCANGAVREGTARNLLVCASDCRLGKPGSMQEEIFGEAAAACVMGSEKVIASLEGSYSVSYDFPDHWRASCDRFDRSLEDRWIRDEGYTKFIPEAIAGLLKKYGMEPKHFARVAYPCLNARVHQRMGGEMGFQPGQIQDPLFKQMGECGSATPLIMLASIMEEAQPGDNILVVSYGNGSEALWFKVTEEIKSRRITGGVRKYLARRMELASYEKYLTYRGILPVEVGARGEPGPTQLAQSWRERKTILGLCGSRCKRCGTPQFPPQKICVNSNCKAMDEMEEYRFSDKKGILFSYTEDHLAFSLSSPQLYGTVDFEGGGRFVFDITDCEPGSLKMGMSMKMTFRKKYVDELRGIHGYFWKAMPVTVEGDRE